MTLLQTHEFNGLRNITLSLEEIHNTDFFNIIAQGNTLVPYLFKLCLDYILRTSIDLMKENGFTLKKKL